MATDDPTIMPAGEHRLIPLAELKAGIPCRVEHQGKGVLLCLVDNVVHAVHDTCTHEDISLSLGVLCEHRLRCPLHGSEFDIRTGKVLDEPAEIDLPVYEVQVVDGWVCL
ncbi:Rieske (2Fe-2S) protein [Granulosicoccus sp. 3-233]|uniref:Rieske (2Fe-2S) protein n=1 Tax=Granulosicoccus sp. 3-233 TaxID=3417969 RepID=UPI003D33F189